MRIIAVTLALMLFGPVAAVAQDAADWIEASHDAVFSAEQTVSCSTPDGVRDGVFSVQGSGSGVTMGRGADQQWAGSEGVFSANSPDDTAAIAVPTDDLVERAAYTSVAVVGERFEGRRTKTFQLSRDDLLRALISFDVSTGAVLRVITYNSDGSEYCSLDTGSFSQPIGLATPVEPPLAETSLEPIEPDPVLAPSELAGFVRLETYRWRESGAVSFYSDGFFSFMLTNSSTPLELDDSDATDVVIGSGTYRRLFEAGQSLHVWETELGGMSLVGDLPLDLQAEVLAELPQPGRPNVLVRFWRRLFR